MKQPLDRRIVQQGVAFGAGIGVGLGAGVGVAMHNIAAGMGLGALAGVAFGWSYIRSRSKTPPA
jgi:hypothetical protein